MPSRAEQLAHAIIGTHYRTRPEQHPSGSVLTEAAKRIAAWIDGAPLDRSEPTAWPVEPITSAEHVYRAEMLAELAAVLDQAEDGARILRDEMGADVAALAETLDRPPVEELSETSAPYYVTLTADERRAILHRAEFGTGGAGLPLDHAEHLAAAVRAIEDAQRGCAACGEPDAAHPIDPDHAEDWQPQHQFIEPAQDAEQ